jgi:hypothetical protein
MVCSQRNEAGLLLSFKCLVPTLGRTMVQAIGMLHVLLRVYLYEYVCNGGDV